MDEKPEGVKRAAKAGANRLDIESLIQKYGVVKEPLQVVLPDGEVFEFKVPESLTALRGTMTAAVQWFTKLPKPGPNVQHPFCPYLPDSQESAVDAYLISTFSVDPKIGQKDALAMVAEAPWMAFSFSQAIREHWRDMESLWIAKAANESKKNLTETSGDNSS